MRQILVASEVALALVVLSGAGLMIKSMSRLLSVNPGLNAKSALSMVVSVPQEEIYVGPARLTSFSVRTWALVPGILSESAIAHLPFEGNAGRGFQIEGQQPADPGHMPGANYTVRVPELLPDHGYPILERLRVHRPRIPWAPFP